MRKYYAIGKCVLTMFPNPKPIGYKPPTFLNAVSRCSGLGYATKIEILRPINRVQYIVAG